MEEKRIIQLLTRKLAGEASPDEVTELNELIAKYPDSTYLVEVFDEIWDDEVSEENVAFFFKRHKKKYKHEFHPTGYVAPVTGPYVLKNKKDNYIIGGACIVLFLAIAGYLFDHLWKKRAEQPVYTQITSGKGIRKSIVLPDGTHVWLNADSRLSYDADMNGNRTRVAELAGEAFFDVVHRKDHPFIIRTDKISITVLGTAFNVKAYPSDRKCETSLIRGAIELSTNDDLSQKFILKPSEKFSVIEGVTKETDGKRNGKLNDRSTLLIEHIAPVKVADKEYVQETSWVQNKLIFENEALGDLAPIFERWFNVKINITGKDAAGYLFTGIFATETIEQALTAMKLIKPFHFTINENEITIY